MCIRDSNSIHQYRPEGGPRILKRLEFQRSLYEGIADNHVGAVPENELRLTDHQTKCGEWCRSGTQMMVWLPTQCFDINEDVTIVATLGLVHWGHSTL